MKDRRLVVVMADDLTGAAEMAGIAWRHGLSVMFNVMTSSLSHEGEVHWLSNSDSLGVGDVLVIATDTRSMSNGEARATVKRIATELLHHPFFHPFTFSSFFFFKKTDSALRGHIVGELSVLMDVFHCSTSLLLPQNPSKGRVVTDGVYTIDGVPLKDTLFGQDPEFPVSSSLVTEILSGCHSLSLSQILADGICLADASSLGDVQVQLSKARQDTLLAGGADLFDTLLSSQFTNRQFRPPLSSFPNSQQGTFVVCGSTFFNPHPSIFTFEMPEDVFHGAAADHWTAQILRHATDGNTFAIAIGSKPTMGRDYAMRLRAIMAKVALEVMLTGHYHTLVVEGGATAYAILRHARLSSFTVEGELEPGVVSLCSSWMEKPFRLILKPGSYPWGTMGQWLL